MANTFWEEMCIRADTYKCMTNRAMWLDGKNDQTPAEAEELARIIERLGWSDDVSDGGATAKLIETP